MKKSVFIVMVGLLAFSYAGSVTPTLSLRVNDVLSGLDFATPVIGLKMDLTDGVYSGFDSDANTSRIYVEKSYGRIGMGTYTAAFGNAVKGEPYFTVGTTYGVLDNLNVELEYVINNLVTNTADVLNLSLTVNF